MENDIITTYLYDKNGNMIKENNSKSGTIYYNYDGYNRLTNVTKPDGQYQTNYYTVGNLRKAIEENGVYTGFTYNAGQVVSEHNSYGEIRQNIIRGYQQIATKDDTNQINYYLHNVHGDITSIVNNEGKMLNAYNYDAYGSITSKEALVPNRYNYAGEQYDNVTGQYYLRARYYNPIIGRFIQEDSFRGDALNLYVYVQNNPVNLVDPTGHCSEKGNKSEEDANKKTDYNISYDLTVYETQPTIIDNASGLLDITSEVGKKYLIKMIKNSIRPNNIGIGSWNKMVQNQVDEFAKVLGAGGKIAKAGSYFAIGIDVTTNINNSIKNGTDIQKIVTDATVDTASGITGLLLAGKVGAEVGTAFSPGIGTAAGFALGLVYTGITDGIKIDNKSLKDHAKNILDSTLDKIEGEITNYIKAHPEETQKAIDFQIKATILPIPMLNLWR